MIFKTNDVIGSADFFWRRYYFSLPPSTRGSCAWIPAILLWALSLLLHHDWRPFICHYVWLTAPPGQPHQYGKPISFNGFWLRLYWWAGRVGPGGWSPVVNELFGCKSGQLARTWETVRLVIIWPLQHFIPSNLPYIHPTPKKQRNTSCILEEKCFQEQSNETKILRKQSNLGKIVLDEINYWKVKTLSCGLLCWCFVGSCVGVLWAPVLVFCGLLCWCFVDSCVGVLWAPVLVFCGLLCWCFVGSCVGVLWAPVLVFCGFLCWCSVGSCVGVLWTPVLVFCGLLCWCFVDFCVGVLWAPVLVFCGLLCWCFVDSCVGVLWAPVLVFCGLLCWCFVGSCVGVLWAPVLVFCGLLCWCFVVVHRLHPSAYNGHSPTGTLELQV